MLGALAASAAMGLASAFAQSEVMGGKPKRRNPHTAGKTAFSPFRRNRYDQRSAEIAAWNKEVEERNRAKRAAKVARKAAR